MHRHIGEVPYACAHMHSATWGRIIIQKNLREASIQWVSYWSVAVHWPPCHHVKMNITVWLRKQHIIYSYNEAWGTDHRRHVCRTPWSRWREVSEDVDGWGEARRRLLGGQGNLLTSFWTCPRRMKSVGAHSKKKKVVHNWGKAV